MARRKKRRRDQQNRARQQQLGLAIDEMKGRESETFGDGGARRQRHHDADDHQRPERPQQPAVDAAQPIGHRAALGQVAGLFRGADVEAEDRRSRPLGEHHVALVDPAGPGQDDPCTDLVGAEFVQRTHDRLGRALDVGLHHQGKFRDFLVGQLGHHVGQGASGAHRRE